MVRSGTTTVCQSAYQSQLCGTTRVWQSAYKSQLFAMVYHLTVLQPAYKSKLFAAVLPHSVAVSIQEPTVRYDTTSQCGGQHTRVNCLLQYYQYHSVAVSIIRVNYSLQYHLTFRHSAYKSPLVAGVPPHSVAVSLPFDHPGSWQSAH